MTKVWVVGTYYDYNRYSIHSIWNTEAQAEHEKAHLIELNKQAKYPFNDYDVEIEEWDVN